MATNDPRFPTAGAAQRRRRLGWTALGIAFWLGLLGGGAVLIGTATKSGDTANLTPSDEAGLAYVAQVGEFREAWTADALAALTTTTIGITLEAKYDLFSQTPRAYEALATQCAALDGTRSTLDELASVPPPVPPTAKQQPVDDTIRASVDDATESIAPLVAPANALLTDGAAQLETLDGLCDSLTRLDPIVDEHAAKTAASVTPLMVQPDTSEHVETASGTVEFECSGDAACQPIASPAREAFAAASSAENTRFDTAAAAFFTDHCPLVELAEYCPLAADHWRAQAAFDTESEARYVKETPLSSSVPLPEYSAWLEQQTAELAASADELDASLAANWPDVVPAQGADRLVTVLSATADTAESRFAELRETASAAVPTG